MAKLTGKTKVALLSLLHLAAPTQSLTMLLSCCIRPSHTLVPLAAVTPNSLLLHHATPSPHPLHLATATPRIIALALHPSLQQSLTWPASQLKSQPVSCIFLPASPLTLVGRSGQEVARKSLLNDSNWGLLGWQSLIINVYIN